MICYRHHRTRVSCDMVVLKLTVDKIRENDRIIDETHTDHEQENLKGLTRCILKRWPRIENSVVGLGCVFYLAKNVNHITS